MDVDCNALIIVVCVLVEVMKGVVGLVLLLSLIWDRFDVCFDFFGCLV